MSNYSFPSAQTFFVGFQTVARIALQYIIHISRHSI